MVEGIAVTERPSPELRCACCHDGAGELEHCERCGTAFHRWCRRTLGRCPTLGCEALVAPSGRTAAASYLEAHGQASRPSFASAVGMSLVTGLVALAGLFAAASFEYDSGYVPGLARAAGIILPLVHFLYAPARWAVKRRGTRSPFGAAMLAVLGVLVPLIAAVGLLALSMPLFALIAVIVVLLAPAFGAWFGAEDTGPPRPTRT